MMSVGDGVRLIDDANSAGVTGLAEVRLCHTVERVLQGAMGRPVKVSGLQSRPSPFATLFPADILNVELEGEPEISLFLKHLGPEQADHPDKQCRDREVRIYEDLLNDARLPVVRYYGSHWNDATQRREVFLEYIDDWDLRYQHIEHWFAAARRLAQFHAIFAGRVEELLTCDFLLRFDADHLHSWADRAVSIVEDRSSKLAAELAGVAAEYGRVADVLTRQPRTLVHNDLAPKNVLAARSSNPARIGFVDWEMAGVGCGLLDLVVLKFGLNPVDDRKMCAAYFEAMEGTNLIPASRQELERLLSACELHRTVYRLAHCTAWKLPLERVAQWVAEARQLLARV